MNVADGRFFCHNPNCGAHGDFVEFYERVRNLRFPDAVNELARRCGLAPVEVGPVYYGPARDWETLNHRNEVALAAYQAPETAIPATATPSNLVIDEQVPTTMHDRLLTSDDELRWLAERRGITRDTVVRFQLGHDGQRYFIPIRDNDGQCVNIRRYSPSARRSIDKMISWRAGFGSARLWPLESLVHDTIYLCEGEMDCILALQLNVPAITTTGGAGTWKAEWTPLFRGKHVIICYDNDNAGYTGANQIAQALLPVAASVKSITWPHTDPPGFDFTDYIQGYGHSIADFYALVAETAEYRPPAEPFETINPETVEKKGLSDAGRAEHNKREFLIDITVSGIASAPSIAPKQTQMYCGHASGTTPLCPKCPMRPGDGVNGGTNGAMNLTVEYTGNEILNYNKVTDAQVLRNLKIAARIPVKCPRVSERRQLSLNVLETAVMPDISGREVSESFTTAQGYVTRSGFQMAGEGKKFLVANTSYRARMRTVANPKTQDIVHVIVDATESQSDLDVFRMSAQILEQMRVFAPRRLDNVDALVEQANLIHGDLERVTRTYERRDLMTAVDMTYLSPIGFSFQGESVVRGWVECLMIGDSRTGKTQAVHRLLIHYGAGEFSSGENTSFAGLVGGLTELGRTWFTRWGKIPLNDRRLLVVDEAGNLPQDQIARMSSMRSSGIAEIIKIHMERTRARTRQIWIANPRGNQPLSSYSHGVLAVKELIGAPEDIARFDLVVTAAATDVSMSVINANRGFETVETYTSNLCNQRVMWAWSRKPDQITFLPETTTEILRLATEHGNKYRFATVIPLVEPNEQRIKLARLAASTAAFFFSASENGEKIIVRPEHAVYAYNFLNHLYAKPSLAYESYALTEQKRFELKLTEEMVRTLRATGSATHALMEQEYLTQSDLMEVLGIDDRARLRSTITQFKTAGFLRRVGTSYYVKTPAAITWLREEIAGRHPSIASNGNGTSPLERSSDHAQLVGYFTEDPDIDSEPPW